jgi:hypothetical protein
MYSQTTPRSRALRDHPIRPPTSRGSPHTLRNQRQLTAVHTLPFHTPHFKTTFNITILWSHLSSGLVLPFRFLHQNSVNIPLPCHVQHPLPSTSSFFIFPPESFVTRVENVETPHYIIFPYSLKSVTELIMKR